MTIKCEIVSIVQPESPFVGSSRSIIFSQCNTHSWSFGQLPIGAGMLCPIGRIEQATEIGIAKLEAAARGDGLK